jgi:hypothetical protein
MRLAKVHALILHGVERVLSVPDGGSIGFRMRKSPPGYPQILLTSLP